MKFCPLCAHELKEVEIDGKPRLSCRAETCDYVYWNNPTPVIAALVERDGEVILARNKSWSQKMFGLITGFLEEGETPETGILPVCAWYHRHWIISARQYSSPRVRYAGSITRENIPLVHSCTQRKQL